MMKEMLTKIMKYDTIYVVNLNRNINNIFMKGGRYLWQD